MPKQPFCYRLTIQGRKFTGVQASTFDCEVDAPVGISEDGKSFEHGGWRAWIMEGGASSYDFPLAWGIAVSYTAEAGIVYRRNYLFPGSGDLFLLMTEDSKATSLFQYRDIGVTLFRLFDINGFIRTTDPNEHFQLTWKRARGQEKFILPWVVTDGQMSIRLSSSPIPISSLTDSWLESLDGTLDVLVSNATWVVLTTLERTAALADQPTISERATLYIGSNSDPADFIPALHEYLREHDLSNFCEPLHYWLP